MLTFNDRRVRVALRMTLVIAVLFSSVWLCWQAYKTTVSLITRQFGITSYSVSYSGIYKDGLAKSIDTWFERKFKSGLLKKQTRASLVEQLHKTFPLIGSVSWQTYMPRKLDCCITGVEPVFRINNTHVAARNGKLYDPADFGLFSQELPGVVVSSEWLTDGVFSSVFSFLVSLPDFVISEYALEYQDPYYMILVPRVQNKEHSYVCIADEQSVHLVRNVRQMELLCADTKKRMKEKGEEVEAILFDVRFDSRIISRPVSSSDYVSLIRGVAS